MWAQAPQKMSYQAVVRNSSDALVRNTTVGVRISILQGSASGTNVFSETQTPTTNANGLVSIEIGGGTQFSAIDWANEIFFMKTEIDPTGGTNYTITGTSQLLSVPYAFHAQTAEAIAGANKLHLGDFYQGGIIFWLDESGQHGLIVSPEDQGIDMVWDDNTQDVTRADRRGVGAGMYNTERIITKVGGSGVAAKLCSDYNGGGYGDWYLPSVDELYFLDEGQNAANIVITGYYWSSNEASNVSAYFYSFGNGTYTGDNKFQTYNVRAIRSF
ncbi:MAG: DUF1566 domain-containing protein [Bacteroidaceae bacterium]|nr:DUF1566 domain-containing protein [Bacteroidaceae bacterium]